MNALKWFYGTSFHSNIGESKMSGSAKLTLEEWLQERLDNCRRHAASKTGADREGWLEDAEYFKLALTAIAAAELRQTVARQAVTIGEYQTALRAKNFEASTMQSNEVNHWVEVCDGLRDELHDIKAQCDQLRQANATIPSLEAELAAAKQAVLDAYMEKEKE